MHYFDGIGADTIENQVIAERTSADAEMFVARYQRIAAWCIRQGLTFLPQLFDKSKRILDALLGDISCNLIQIGFGRGS